MLSSRLDLNAASYGTDATKSRRLCVPALRIQLVPSELGQSSKIFDECVA